jgi:nucleoside-diphosphate-sugar epimerase
MFADSSRARSLFGWTPRVNLDEGLKLTVDWYRQYLATGGAHLE